VENKEFRNGYVFGDELARALRAIGLKVKSESFPDNSDLHSASIRRRQSACIIISPDYDTVQIEVRIEITRKHLNVINLLESGIQGNWPKRKYDLKRIDMESIDTNKLARELKDNLLFYLDYVEGGIKRMEDPLRAYLAEFKKAKNL